MAAVLAKDKDSRRCVTSTGEGHWAAGVYVIHNIVLKHFNLEVWGGYLLMGIVFFRKKSAHLYVFLLFFFNTNMPVSIEVRVLSPYGIRGVLHVQHFTREQNQVVLKKYSS